MSKKNDDLANDFIDLLNFQRAEKQFTFRMERALCCIGEVLGYGFFGRVIVCLTTPPFRLQRRFVRCEIKVINLIGVNIEYIRKYLWKKMSVLANPRDKRIFQLIKADSILL
jgi:hypothetical protein